MMNTRMDILKDRKMIINEGHINREKLEKDREKNKKRREKK